MTRFQCERGSERGRTDNDDDDGRVEAGECMYVFGTPLVARVLLLPKGNHHHDDDEVVADASAVAAEEKEEEAEDVAAVEAVEDVADGDKVSVFLTD